ncbi:oligosaccharide flippase family protein [Frigoribacterium sp. CFBP 13712]|nr:oligosaccharide flippase family protein [Frigoribacterium sp. CFBP 13712]
MHKSRSGLSGVLSSGGTGVVSLIAGIVLLPIILNTIGAAPYGVWLVLFAGASYLNYSDLGVGTAIVHFGSRARAGGERRGMSDLLSAAMTWNTAAFLVIVPGFIALAALYLDWHSDQASLSATESACLLGLSAATTLSLLLKPFASALIGSGMLPTERANQAVGVGLRFVGTLVACLGGFGVVGVAMAEAAALIVPLLVAVVQVFRRRIARLAFRRGIVSDIRFMLGYSTKSFAVSLVGTLILQSGTVMAGAALGPAQATYFNAAFRIYSSIRQLLGWVVDPFRSLLSRLNVGSRDKADQVVQALSFLCLTMVGVGCGVLLLSAHEVTVLWLGSDVPTREVALCMQILVGGLMLNAIHLALIPAGDAAGRPGVFFPAQLLWLVLYVGGGVALATTFGIVGLAIALTAPLAVVEPLYLIIARRSLGLDLAYWARFALLPAALVVAAGAMLVASASVGASLADVAINGWGAGGLFLSGCVASAFITRRKAPWAAIRASLRAEL